MIVRLFNYKHNEKALSVFNYKLHFVSIIGAGSGFPIVAYPNPTCDFVTIKFEMDDIGELECILFDLSGSMLLREKQIFNEKKISFEKHNPGIYFMKIIYEGKVIQTFKIIKK